MRKLLPLLFLLLLGATRASPVLAQGQYVSGAVTAADSSTICSGAGGYVSIPVTSNTGAVAFSVSGTFSATLEFRGTVDGTNWVLVNAYPPNSTTAATSTTSAGTWTAGVAGLATLCVRASAYTSGTATINMRNAIPVSISSLTGGGGGGGSLSGTPNQIDVATGTTTPVISLDAAIILPGSLTVPSGSSLTTSGTGTNNATSLNGATFASPGAIGGTTPSCINATSMIDVTCPPYSADPTGVADSTTGIQAAITAAQAGTTSKHIHIPKGTYKITATLTCGASAANCNGMIFEGEGGGQTASSSATTFEWAGAANGTMFTFTNAEGITLQHFLVDGMAATPSIGILFAVNNSQSFPTYDNHVDDVWIGGINGTAGKGISVNANVYGANQNIAFITFSNIHFVNAEAGVSALTDYYQIGTQNINLVWTEHNDFTGYTSRGMDIESGDVRVDHAAFSGATSGSNIDDVYVAATAWWASFRDTYHEITASSSVGTRHAFNFPTGARPYPTLIEGSRVAWFLTGGSPLDFEQTGPISIISSMFDYNGVGSGTVVIHNTGSTPLTAVLKGNYLTPFTWAISGPVFDERSDWTPHGILTENWFSGDTAGNGTLSGGYNVGYGFEADTAVAAGASNDAFGAYSLAATAGGSNNTGMGDQACLTNATGNGNSCFGYQSDVSTSALSGATAIGYQAKVSTSNTAVIGSSALTDVYFGSTTPSATVHGAGGIFPALNSSIYVDGTTYALSAAGINAAIAALPAGGGTVVLPTGTITTTACINLVSNLHLIGQGAGQSSVLTTAATIITNGSSDVFCAPASTVLTGMLLEQFKVITTAGGGHIFNFTDTQAVVNNEIRNVELVQQLAAKAVIYAPSTGGSAGFYGNHVHDFNMYYAASSTVPAIDILETTVNGDTFENFISSGSNTAAGTYAIFLEQSANNPMYGIAIRNGTFENAGGGGVHVGGSYDNVFESLAAYDLSVIQNHPFIDIVASGAGTASHNNVIRNCWSANASTSSASFPDVNLVDASSSELIQNSNFLFVNTANYFTSISSTLGTVNNTYAVTTINPASMKAANTLEIGSTVGGTPGTLYIDSNTASGQLAQTLSATASTPAIVWGSASGTPAVTASAPLGITTATGNATCATCTTNASALTANIIVKGSGSQATQTSSITDDAKNITTAEVISAGNKVFLGGDFTDSTSGSLVLVTGLSYTLPTSKAANYSFHCSLIYDQTSAAVADQFGVGVTGTAPTQLNVGGTVQITAGPPSTYVSGTLLALASTTPTLVVSFTPGVAATMYRAELDGTIEQPSNATPGVFSLYAFTTTGTDNLVVKRGSYCSLF